jgi:hypothetical protein
LISSILNHQSSFFIFVSFKLHLGLETEKRWFKTA